METTIKFNPDLGNIAMSAFIIEKIHRCEDCPIRQMATQTPPLDLRPPPCLAHNLVAGLESPPGEGMRLPQHGKGLSLN